MPDFASALVSRCSANVPLTALVGARLDWGVRPSLDAGQRCIVFSVASDDRPDHFGGEQGFRRTRVQAECWSSVSADDAAQTAEALIAVVRPPLGSPGVHVDGGWDQDGIRFGRPQIEGPVDSGEQLDKLYVHCARVDLLLWHGEMEDV